MRGIVAGIGIALVAAGVSPAQDTPLDPHTSVAINFPPDSPVTLVSAVDDTRRVALFVLATCAVLALVCYRMAIARR